MTATGYRILGIIACILHLAEAQDSLHIPGIRLFPESHRIEEFIADGTAHRFSVSKQTESGDLSVSVGGVIPWAEMTVAGLPLQLSTGASVRTRLDPGQSIAVVSTDFFVDYLIVDASLSPNIVIRAGIGHTSHHLGDSFFSDSGKTPIDYSKDYFRLHIVQQILSSRARIYGGIFYAYNVVAGRRLSEPFNVHIGMDGVIFRFAPPLCVYGGLDVKMLQEHGFGSTQRYEAGVKWDKGGGRSFRIGLALFTGLDERGQFLGKRSKGASIGIYADL